MGIDSTDMPPLCRGTPSGAMEGCLADAWAPCVPYGPYPTEQRAGGMQGVPHTPESSVRGLPG